MAFLMLADGTCFQGRSVGAVTHAIGEIVFNTSHLGYQEILTDPSYFKQIINFTTPHIGNVGINCLNYESKKIHAAGAIFRAFSEQVYHWQSKGNLSQFLKEHRIPALSDLDTRALTLHLREHGAQMGCIVATTMAPEEASALIKKEQKNKAANEACLVSTKEIYTYITQKNYQHHLIVIDCGIKAGILQALAPYPLKITVVPEAIQFTELMSLEPDGVLLSNGPGDPQFSTSLIEVAKQLLAAQIPLFGICLGHQILALAGGAQIKKMKFGHHGANHPIYCLASKSVFISSQNHGYVVDEQSLPESLEVTHISLFDQTIAGLKHKQSPAFSFQGHPEANPGPRELSSLFQTFMKMVRYA